MKKILIIINNLGVGGAERLVVDDINEMIRRGISVRLLTLKKEFKFSLGTQCVINKQYWYTINFGSLFNIFHWFQVFWYVKKEKPDIVFTHLWFANSIGRIACRLAGVKNVISFEHNVYETIKNNKMYIADKFLQGWSKKIVAVSSAVNSSLLKNGIKGKNIIIINNGINILKYNRKSEINLKEIIGLEKNAFVFLTIGRLIHQKGIDVLLRAFAKLSGDSILLIVGSGSEEGSLKILAKDLGVSDRVIFLGIRSDIPDIISICDVFVLASRFEGLGIVVLEAMASKKPVILSNFEASKDMVDANINGLIVDIENSNSLAEAMNTLMIDKDMRNTFSEKSFKKVQAFSVQKHVDEIMKL